MKKMKIWDSDLNVGIGIIDNQHKIIFDLINDLYKAIDAKADKKVIDTLFDVVENYVFRHFEAEEELFQNQKGNIEHSLDHYTLVKEFRKIKLSFRNRNNPENATSNFLGKWFYEHIKREDIPLFTRITMGGKEQTKTEVDAYRFEEKERRRHKHIPFIKNADNDLVAYCYNATTLKENIVTIVDISLGGMRIVSSNDYAVGDLLIINCTIENKFNMNEKIMVKNVADNSYGVEFINLSPATEKFLIELYRAVNTENF